MKITESVEGIERLFSVDRFIIMVFFLMEWIFFLTPQV
jgi:hypothetical protein